MNPSPITEEMVLEILRQVNDPELGINIVDLGLVYNIAIAGPNVSVQMTLTTPGCPMAESISYGARCALQQLESVKEVEVEIVWEPRWNPEMMTERGRALVGMR